MPEADYGGRPIDRQMTTHRRDELGAALRVRLLNKGQLRFLRKYFFSVEWLGAIQC